MTLKPEHIVEALNKKTFDEIDPDEVLKHYGYKPEEVRCNGVGIGVWRKEEAFQKLGDIGAYTVPDYAEAKLQELVAMLAETHIGEQEEPEQTFDDLNTEKDSEQQE